MKSMFVNEIKGKKYIESTFMIVKILSKDDERTVAYIGDKTGDVKANIPDPKKELRIGDVIKVKGEMDSVLVVSSFKKVKNYDLLDYIQSSKRPTEDMIKELEILSDESFKSKEVIALNDYFFKDSAFLEKFKMSIGGLKQHHNYLGGLVEHTLNVMYLSKVYAERYSCEHKEIAILGAKLHDIGKIEEYFTKGPFETTTRGEMEGHIVIGVEMLEEAFRDGGNIYSEEFKLRMKGCIIQHHGKVEYGSPKEPRTEEAFIVHLADYVDAIMSKIEQIKDVTNEGEWSEYDRRIGTRIWR